MQTAAFLAWLGVTGVLPTPPPTTLHLSDPPIATEEGGEAPPEEPEREETQTGDEEPGADGGADRQSEDLRAALALRRDLRIPHIIAGNATFGSMTGAFIFGWIHFADRYGYTGNEADSGCFRGDPILGTEMCASQPPWPHVIGSAIAVTAFSAAILMGSVMPDPLHLADQEGDRAMWLSVHRAVRWGLFGLLVAQVALGVVSVAVDLGNFEDERALATAHLALGAVTYATLIPLAVTGWLLAWG